VSYITSTFNTTLEPLLRDSELFAVEVLTQRLVLGRPLWVMICRSWSVQGFICGNHKRR